MVQKTGIGKASWDILLRDVWWQRVESVASIRNIKTGRTPRDFWMEMDISM